MWQNYGQMCLIFGHWPYSMTKSFHEREINDHVFAYNNNNNDEKLVELLLFYMSALKSY